jgi:hypothetical protein
MSHYEELLGNGHTNTSQQIVLMTTLKCYRYSYRVFDFLRPAMLSALQNDCESHALGMRHDEKEDDFLWLIGTWVIQDLLEGHIGYSDELFEAWESKSTPECQCHVLLNRCSSIGESGSARSDTVFEPMRIWDRLYDRATSVDEVDYLQSSLYHLIKTGVLPHDQWVARLAKTYAFGTDWLHLLWLKDELVDLAMGHPDEAISVLDAATTNATGEQQLRCHALSSAAAPVIGTILLRNGMNYDEGIRDLMSKLARVGGITDLDSSVLRFIDDRREENNQS